ncbi:MAG: hypothetical protein CMJ77_22295 [Planctomycetaceae bacterium]|nr:hypothetical protein [Planctomycetaceae bacterium]
MKDRPQNELLPANSPAGQYSLDTVVREAARSQKDVNKLRQYLTLLWASQLRWWKISLPLSCILAIAAGVGAWFTVESTYTANAMLRIQEVAPYVAFKQSENSRSFVNTQLQLFRTRTVVQSALAEVMEKFPETAEKEDPVLWIQLGISARLIGASELVTVKFTDPDPRLAKAVVQSVVDTYMRYQRDYSNQQDEQVIRLLRDEVSDRQVALKTLRQEVTELSKNAIIDRTVDSSSDSSLQSIQNLLIRTEVELTVSNAQLAAVEHQVTTDDQEISPAQLEAMLESSIDYSQMRNELAQADTRLEMLSSRLLSPESSTRYQQAKQQRDELAQAIEEYQKRFQVDGKEAASKYRKVQQEERLTAMRKEIEAKETMRDYLRSRLDEAKEDDVVVSSDKNQDTVAFEIKSRELKQQEAIYNRITDRIMHLQTEKYAPARVALVDPAVKPKEADNSPWAIIVVAVMAAFGAPLGLVFAYEFLMQRVNDSSFIEEQNLEVVGEIATLPRYLPATGSGSGDVEHRHLTLFEESIDHLCNTLRLSSNTAGKQLIAVTSAVSGEGKTHVSAQLAISLAKSVKEPVLLLETDFRAPDIGRMFGFESRQGVLDMFVGGVSLDDVILRDAHPYLDVILAGTQHRDLHGVLHQNDISNLLETVRKRYRYIVIDTPPVLGAGEAVLFACHADASLICARRGYSRMSQVVQVRDRLSRAQANPVGVVLNGVSRRQYIYSYGNYEFVNG